MFHRVGDDLKVAPGVAGVVRSNDGVARTSAPDHGRPPRGYEAPATLGERTLVIG